MTPIIQAQTTAVKLKAKLKAGELDISKTQVIKNSPKL